MRILNGGIVAAAALVLLGGCSNGDEKNEKDGADAVETVVSADELQTEAPQQDSIADEADADSKLIEQAQLAMLEELFADDAGEDEDKLRKNCTRNALKQLRDDFDYDCESGDCIAIWAINGRVDSSRAFLESLKRVGPDKYRAIFKVMMEDTKRETSVMEYNLTEENGRWKIDSYKQISYK